MAQNITLLGASYSNVPAVQLPKTGGGTATFTDVTDTTAAASDVSQGKYFYTASGVRTAGTSSGGGGASQTIYTGTSEPSSSLGSNGDIYIKASSGGTLEGYPESFEASGMNSTSNLSACIGKSAEEGSSTSNVYSSGQSTTGIVDYSFDLSSIPSNASITSVACAVKAHEENASRSSCILQLYANGNAKGSATTVSGTSNAIYNLNTGSWTRAELDGLTLRMSVGYYGGLIAGATLTIAYEMEEASYEVTLTGNASTWSISGNGIYKKANGSWSSASSVELENTIGRS